MTVRKAREENWAIYVMKGMKQTTVSTLRKQLSNHRYHQLTSAITLAIQEIKNEQRERKKK